MTETTHAAAPSPSPETAIKETIMHTTRVPNPTSHKRPTVDTLRTAHAIVAGFILLFAGVLRSTAATVTETILHNVYDIQNIVLSDQHGGGGWYVGRHATLGRKLDGGNDNPWLPAGDSQDIYWQMVYPAPLYLEQVRIQINGGSGASFEGTGGKVQYTTVASPGPGDWSDLVTDINTTGPKTYNAGTDFTALDVHGLRWILPPAGVSDGGNWKPYPQYLHGLGTNTVEVDSRFNLMPQHATVISNITWNSTNNTAAVNDNHPGPRAMWNSGALPGNATLTFSLDGKGYFLDLLCLNWEGVTQSFHPTSYDLYYSMDGSNWTLFADNHAVPADGTQDFIALGGIGAKYVELRDFVGSTSGHVILHEAMLYGVPVPEPTSLALLGLAGLALLRRRR